MSRRIVTALGLFTVLAWSIGFGGRSVSAQPLIWRITSPAEGQRFVGDVRRVTIAVSKPSDKKGILRVTRSDSGVGQTDEIPLGIGKVEYGTIDNKGARLADGTYRLDVFDADDPKLLMAQSSFIIAGSDFPESLPNITFPNWDTQFPADVPYVRFAGRASGPVWLGIKRDWTPVFVINVDSNEDGHYWELDLPWTFGTGQFQVDLFELDPRSVNQVPHDGRTFRVGREGEVAPPLQWQSLGRD